MAIRKRVVEVVRFPGDLSAATAKSFAGELEQCMLGDRPFLVIDCSEIRQLDRSGLQLLVCCLEEAMKRNGDVKLAAILPKAKAVLTATGISRLFETFPTISEAVNSFHQLPMHAHPETHVTGSPIRISGNAA